MMVFNITQPCVTSSEPELIVRREKGGIHTILHIHRSNNQRASIQLQPAACAQLSRGYAALGALERQYTHLQFQEPQTKLWISLSYTVDSLHKENNWKDLGCHVVSMNSSMIRNNALTPHQITQAAMGVAPIINQTLF